MSVPVNAKCFYCSQPAIHRDHAVPYSRGGRGTQNLVPACARCNTRKGALTVDEFRIYLMLRYGRPPEPFSGEAVGPQRDWLIVHQAEHPLKRSQKDLNALRLELRTSRLTQYLGAPP
jgi:hypothetical protein